MKFFYIISCFFIVAVAYAQSRDSYISKGNDYYRDGNFAQAEVYYRQAVQMNQHDEAAKYNLANSLYKQKKYQEAQDIYDELSRSRNTERSAASFYNTGVAYSAQKELESSIEAYKNALRINPDDRKARENLQKALSELRSQQNQQSQNKNQSNMGGGAADEKLKQLEQKEKQAQQRMQNNKKGEGGTMSKDW